MSVDGDGGVCTQEGGVCRQGWGVCRQEGGSVDREGGEGAIAKNGSICLDYLHCLYQTVLL